VIIMSNNKNFYDHFTKSADSGITAVGKLYSKIVSQWLLKVIRRYLTKQNIKFLEVGPGLGLFADECNKLIGLDYFCVEANHNMAEDLKNRGFSVYHSFVPPIPGSDKYDVIFMDQVFEHMESRNHAERLIISCKEHLFNDGLLVISCPDIEYWKEDFFVGDYTHDYPTSQRRLEQMFIDAKLEIKYSTVYSSLFKGRFMVSIITFFVRFFFAIGFFHILFGKKAFIAKSSLLPSCLIVGKYIDSGHV